MEFKNVTLRCDCNSELVVFTKCIHGDNDISYDISVEDGYIGTAYQGFFGRIKRAWKAFTDKPVFYTGMYCEDKGKMKKFLTDCLVLIDEEEV